MTAGSGPRFAESLRAFDTFLDIFQEICMREGGPLAKRVAAKLERRPAARQSVPPRRDPVAAHFPTLARLGIPETAPLIGAVAELSDRLPWVRSTLADGPMLEFDRGHCYCTLVGPEAWVPMKDLYLGLYIQAPNVMYPAHEHAAEELYFTLAGTGDWAKGPKQPGAKDFVPMPPGVFIRHRPWQAHAMETKAEPMLAAWAWVGDFDGGFRWSRGLGT